jgi:hypothetical protein
MIEARGFSGSPQGQAMNRYSLIMLQTPLVAHDLSLTLAELTGTQCIMSADVEDACQQLTALQPGALLHAFIQSDFKSLKDSPLLTLVTALGGQLVLIGHSAELEAAGGEAGAAPPVLMQPFGLAQVTDVLSRITPRASQDDPFPAQA